MPKRSQAESLQIVEKVLKGEITWKTIEQGDYPVIDLAYVGMALIIISKDLHSPHYIGKGYMLQLTLAKTFDLLFIVGRKFSKRTAQTIADNCRRSGFTEVTEFGVTIHPPAELIALAVRYGENDHVKAFLNRQG